MSRLTVLPPCDDKNILDITMNLYLYPAILVAHRQGFFRLLDTCGKSAEEIAESLDLHHRPVKALLAALRATKLIQQDGEKFSLTVEAKTFLVEGSPNYFGSFWDLMYENSENFSIPELEKSILTNKAQVYAQQELFDSNTTDLAKAQRFTRAMHGLSMGSASVWPHKLDLSRHQTFLDIGGASGAHSLCAVDHWKNLRAIIYDLPEICEIAKTYITDHNKQDSISVHSGNMWSDPFPEADIHFYSNILHDWEPEQNQMLVEKSYRSLPKGGRIIIHEILYEDDFSGPPSAAAYSIMMLGWTRGRQYSGYELVELLRGCGFHNICTERSLGYFSIVTGVK
ncbi:methyltransferase [Pseudomonas aeruginosa]